MKKLLLLTLLTAIPMSHCCAFDMEDNGYSKGAASYLDINPYARASAMGGAYTSIASGMGSFMSNPAGLGFSHEIEFSNMSAALGLDRNLFFSGVLIPIMKEIAAFEDFDESRWSKFVQQKEYSQYAFGVSYMDFGISDIEGRDEYGIKTSDFHNKERMISLSYGQRLYKNLSFGLGYKYLTQKLEKSKASGFGFDFGLLYTLMNNKFAMGLTARDVFSKIKWEVTDQALNIDYSYSEDVLMKIIMGFSCKFHGNRGIIALDLNKTEDVKLTANLGAEYALLNVLRIRAGIDRYLPTIGWGVYVPITEKLLLNLDYAFHYDTDEFSNLHYITMNLTFDMPIIEPNLN